MPLELPPHRPLSESAADAIRAAIEAGELAPGERLVERRLAAQLGISHIPVREALARLEDEGIVTRTPRQGARVAELSDRDLDEIASVRVVLEQLVVEQAVAHWSPEATARLDAIVAEMHARAKANDAVAFVELDRRFHETLWQLAEHRLLSELAQEIRSRVNRFLRAATLRLTRDELIYQAAEHRELVELMSAGDVRRARTAMRRHIVAAAGRAKRR